MHTLPARKRPLLGGQTNSSHSCVAATDGTHPPPILRIRVSPSPGIILCIWREALRESGYLCSGTHRDKRLGRFGHGATVVDMQKSAVPAPRHPSSGTSRSPATHRRTLLSLARLV